MSNTIQIKDTEIPDYSGALTERLDGIFTEYELTNKLIEY